MTLLTYHRDHLRIEALRTADKLAMRRVIVGIATPTVVVLLALVPLLQGGM